MVKHTQAIRWRCRQQPANCLNVFGQSVGLAPKRLNQVDIINVCKSKCEKNCLTIRYWKYFEDRSKEEPSVCRTMGFAIIHLPLTFCKFHYIYLFILFALYL